MKILKSDALKLRLINNSLKIVNQIQNKMKKIFLVAVIFISVASSVAQKKAISNSTTISLGGELSAPSGLFHTYGYKVGFGGSIQLEYKPSTDMGLTLNAGYLNYGNTSIANYHYSVIPFLGGVKYYFSPKVYGHAQLGAGFTTLKLPSRNFTKTNFVYSPGIGFMISKDVDILVKYTGIANSIAFFDNNGNFIPNQAASTFGVRLAYNFGK